jgi:hypothetical protein
MFRELLCPSSGAPPTAFAASGYRMIAGMDVFQAVVGAETWALWAVDQKHLECFEMWCWRRMEKISWTEHVRKEEVLLRGKEQRNILHEKRERKANWIGHILRRNCFLQRVIEEKYKGG